ncbi:ethanolamine utilization protein EutA [Noviherbaspirillum humi]|uniref:Ethanolamine utilization protein EutA n=1 Tax=Noviherbaspirillum humi TaxID=1688639 RepID=A0A239ET21_9BURK|nr:ethanolamine ammonia-lyase reactivating factor EutA [Noviherbaspirillum humi]SNS47777.1 ethanolamine utilization protein EutA [Noviherbaspirillum humi]
MPHDLDFDHEHEQMSAAQRDALARFLWEQETIALTTVGIDIGSSTSHLIFARVVLQRLAEGLSSRFVVVERRVLWRSPIMLTPFLPDGTIDAHELQHFIHHAYHDAGLARGDVDSGAVILTGEAIKRRNARVIDEIFARESGKFVCATAGHKLECILAAHGAGATALSKRRGQCGLHVDIGGGTTKLALIDNGNIVSVAAFAAGGRLLAQDTAGAWSRIDDAARLAAQELGMAATPAAFDSSAGRQAVAARLAAIIMDRITGTPLDGLGRQLMLTDPLHRTVEPEFVTFSGGVAEYLFGHETRDHGDIAPLLAAEIVAQIKARLAIPVVEPQERIRATVIGASQFTVQVSGKTIYLPDRAALPVRNLPVLHLGVDLPEHIDSEAVASALAREADLVNLDASARLAIAFTWQGEPEHARLLAMARAIMGFAAPGGHRHAPLFLMIDGDVGASLGRILHEELGLEDGVVSIDGVQLRPLDFVDIGELIDPPGVVPVVIKSLLFPGDIPAG